MTEVAAGTPTTGVAPLAVLGGHPDDAPADRVHAPWAARSATAAAVVCPRDQLSMPAEEGIGRDQGVPVTASPSLEARGLGGPAPAVPGHWEGDLIIGLDSSAIGTLVERTTRFTMLLHLPRMAERGRLRVKNGPALAGHGAEAVRDAIASTIATLPDQLRRSLTWDQGAEMAQHAQLRIDTGLQVFFCDPRSPWRRPHQL